MVHERYRQTTDRRTDDIANVNVSSRSLKIQKRQSELIDYILPTRGEFVKKPSTAIFTVNTDDLVAVLQ